MGEKELRKIARITRVHEVGGSLMIVLPAEFVRAHGIKKGDDVGILANHVLKLDPMKEGEFEEEPVGKGKAKVELAG